MPEPRKPKSLDELKRETFDAHQFQVAADAAYAVPKAARGGARDLSEREDDAQPHKSGETVQTAVDGSDPNPGQVKGKYRTLAEMQESKRYVEGDAPPVMDTIWKGPEVVQKPASLKGRLTPDYRGGTFVDPGPVQPASVIGDDEVYEPDYVGALSGEAPKGPGPEIKQDPRVRYVGKHKFLSL
jgi:hypothetical protein